MSKKIVVCVIVPSERHEVAILTAQSLVGLQTHMMTDPKNEITVELVFVRTFDEALNFAWKSSDAHGVFVVNGNISFNPEFLVEAVRSELPVVVGTYPLPVVDWNRVKSMPANEPVEQWGNVYNVTIERVDGKHGYGLVSRANARLGIVYATRRALQDIAAAHPEIVAKTSGDACFAGPGVYDGTKMDEYERFLSLFDGDVWADIQRPGQCMAVTEFGGCVGLRSALR